jgi:hypothetical protein
MAVRITILEADGKYSYHGACTGKLFTAVIYELFKQARVFVPGKPFQPSLMFVGESTSLL